MPSIVGQQRSGFIRAGWGSTLENTPGLVSRRDAKIPLIQPMLFSLVICPAKNDRHRWVESEPLSGADAVEKVFDEARAEPWREKATERLWALNPA